MRAYLDVEAADPGCEGERLRLRPSRLRLPVGECRRSPALRAPRACASSARRRPRWRCSATRSRARALAESRRHPVVPGSAGAVRHRRGGRQRRLQKLGYPVMLKAAAGGGGRGMRVVDAERRWPRRSPAAAARREAAFGDGALFVEKLVDAAAAHRGAGPGRPPGQRRPPLRARLLGAAAPPEGGRGRAGARARRRVCASGILADAVTPGARRRLRERRHRRVPRRPRDGRALLHRVQSAHPGRAHGHRAGARASTWSRRSSASPRASRWRRSASPTRGRRPPRGFAVQARVVATAPGTLTAYKEPSGPGVRVDACGYLGLRAAAAVRSAAGQGHRRVELVAARSTRRSTGPLRALEEFHIAGLPTNLAAAARHPGPSRVPAPATPARLCWLGADRACDGRAQATSKLRDLALLGAARRRAAAGRGSAARRLARPLARSPPGRSGVESPHGRHRGRGRGARRRHGRRRRDAAGRQRHEDGDASSAAPCAGVVELRGAERGRRHGRRPGRSSP